MSEHEDKKKGTGSGAVVGAAVGGVAAGATTGALAGGITGPVGAVIGAAVGAVVGAVSGRAASSTDEIGTDATRMHGHGSTLDHDSIAPRESGRTAGTNSGDTLEVVEEQLQVGKREVDHGGVRVVQRVSEKPVHETVRLHEEHAVVDRHPVDRVASSEDLADFKDATLEVRETSEQAVVAKTARVVEEVRVGKEVREHDEVIEDTLRRKDVDVERLSPASSRSIERERAVAADDALDGTRRNSDKPM
jgi:uncharacterized protein (TIGR02271 family)